MQWQQNDGKCGICGDAYNMPSPRSHEAGGEYGRGVITRRYTAGQVNITYCFLNIFLTFKTMYKFLFEIEHVENRGHEASRL